MRRGAFAIVAGLGNRREATWATLGVCINCNIGIEVLGYGPLGIRALGVNIVECNRFLVWLYWFLANFVVFPSLLSLVMFYYFQ